MRENRGEISIVRQFDITEMAPEEIVAKVRGYPSESHPLASTVEFFKGLISRSHEPPVYRAHSKMDTALDLTPDIQDAVARIY